MIRSITHDQPQKNFKYLWLDFRFILKFEIVSDFGAPVKTGKVL